jgi:hypothetical protein
MRMTPSWLWSLVVKAVWNSLSSYRRMFRITWRVLFRPTQFAKTISFESESGLTKGAVYWLHAINYLVRSGIYTIIAVIAVRGLLYPGRAQEAALSALTMEVIAFGSYGLLLLLISSLWFRFLHRRKGTDLPIRTFLHSLLYTSGAGSIVLIIPTVIFIVLLNTWVGTLDKESQSLRIFAMISQCVFGLVSIWAANSTAIILAANTGIAKAEILKTFWASIISSAVLMSLSFQLALAAIRAIR